MANVAFRYTNSPIAALSYDGSALNQYSYNPLYMSGFIPFTSVDSGRLLNGGRGYEHTLYTYEKVRIVLSADTLEEVSDVPFLMEFWRAKHKYIAIDEGSGFSNYIEVTTGGGEFPLSYVEELKELPEIEFQFETVGVL